MLSTALMFLLAMPAIDSPSPAKALLDKMVASRTTAFATADIRWTMDAKGYPTRYRRSRIDGKNWTYEETADPDGLVHPDLGLGQPGSCSEYRYLNVDGTQWMVREHDAQPSIWDSRADPKTGMNARLRGSFDVRTLGLSPEPTVKSVEAVLPSIIGDISGDEALSVKDADQGVSIVSVKRDAATVSWWIDTKRGFNPVKIEVRRNEPQSPLIASAAIELAFYDNHVWFPKRVVYTTINNKAGNLAMSVYDLQPEFDRPEHPTLLNPTHIGVVPYDVVAWQRTIGRPRETQVWDGRRFISVDEVMRQIKSGELLPETLAATSDKTKRIAASNKGRWPAWVADKSYGVKPSDVDEWEKYVRRFCIAAKWDDRQRASAKSILDDCRKSATPLVTMARDEKDAAKRDALLASVTEIFNKSLVPRLKSQLTIAQSQPTSQPVVSASNATPNR